MISTNVSINSYSTGSVTPNSYRTEQNNSSKDEVNTTETEKEKEAQKETEVDNQNKLTDEEQKKVDTLKKRDTEVKAHEMAHAAIGGQYAGSASFEYQTGPNGVKYAVGGEVSIDVSKVAGDPEATIAKMEIIQKAALAPASPSSADRAIAASASMKEIEARSEIMKANTENQNSSPNKPTGEAKYSEDSEDQKKGETLDIVI